MTFRPFFIYLASIFIFIGCVSGIDHSESSESCKSSADYFGNTKLYHTLLGAPLRQQVASAAQRASDAHDRLATAHHSEAEYWQGIVHAITPFENRTHPYQTAHMDAMRLHRGRATEHASHRRDVLKRKDAHPDDLLALKEQFESSEQHATAGLMHLKASNAYKEAAGHAKRVGDRAVAQSLLQKMILQTRHSLNHTPANAANFNPEHAISDASIAEQNANLISRHFMQRVEPLQRKRKRDH
jgi:hypothetical protein